jgi:hypothetical protein
MFKLIKKLFRALRPKSPYAVLEQKLVDLKDTDLREAAEHAYALAMLYKQKGNTAKAILYGRDAIALFDRCKLRTQWDSMRRHETIEGITIPEYVGKSVVRDQLKPIDLSIPVKDEDDGR